MGFKYEAIKAYLIDHGVDVSLAETMHAIYATQRLGGTANAYFLIVFTEKEVYIISITPLGKLGKIIATLPEEMIRSYQFKKRLFIGMFPIRMDWWERSRRILPTCTCRS